MLVLAATSAPSPEPLETLAGTFRHDLGRPDGSTEDLIALSGWTFESRRFYEMPVQVKASDQLVMTCGYSNNTNQCVAGLATGPEMCFDLLVVTPKSAEQQGI